MANKCAICGAEINLIQTQKLADGNCICRKNCRKNGFKEYDYVHGNLPGVKAHLAQAVGSLDAAIYGDRTEWILKSDAAIKAFNG